MFIEEGSVGGFAPVGACDWAAQSVYPSTVRRLLVLGISVALGMLAVGALLLFDARQDAWRQAERSSTNLVKTLERDIARNFAIYDLSLTGAIEALGEPGIADIRPELRQSAIFDRAASAEYLGSFIILDRNGVIAFDSKSLPAQALNLSDRDYFRAHQEDLNAGLFLSLPFRSRLRSNDLTIAISRRITGPSGAFNGGVAVAALRLAYFDDMFQNLDLGRDGIVLLVRDDGRLVARYPPVDDAMPRDFSTSPVTGAIVAGGTGQVVAASTIDGVTRMYEYRRIGHLPLHIAVGMSVDEVLAPWWRKATIIGGILVVLATGSVVMCLLFRRELTRRVQAETSLKNAASRLEMAAKTDALTGLPNRRAFTEGLDAAWRNACSHGTALSLLMIDADGFKLFNDRFGHEEGDRALRAVAEAIRTSLRRNGDLGARYGGEEFTVLLPNTDEAGAVLLAERIRRRVRAAAIPHPDGPDGYVTVSIGVSTTFPQRGEREGNLVRTADVALYDAKHTGRNRVCVSTGGSMRAAPPEPVPPRTARTSLPA